MSIEEARQASLNLMKAAEAAYFTTVESSGFPRTRAMANLRREEEFPRLRPFFTRHQDDFWVYFTTQASSRKIENLRRNPKASVYFRKSGSHQELLLEGTAEIVEEPELKKDSWKEEWRTYYHAGPDDPGYTVVRFRPYYGRYFDNQAVEFRWPQ